MSYLVYVTILFLSFVILSLQVILGVIFNALSFTPFFTISFSLLGLTLAGVFVYLKDRDRMNVDFQATILRSLYVAGLLLVFYTLLLRNFSLIPFIANADIISERYWNRMLVEAIGSSLGIGAVFIFAFFSLGIIYSLVYKMYSHESGKIYFFDLIGASLGCVFGTIGLNYVQPSSVLLVLSLSVFCLAAFYEYYFKTYRSIKAVLYTVGCCALLVVNMKTDFLEVKVKDYHVYYSVVMPSYQEVWHRWNAYSRVGLLRNTQPERVSSYNPEYTFSIQDGRARVLPFDPHNRYAWKPDVSVPVRLSFLLKEPAHILVIAAGAGREMIEAYNHSKGRADITGVELNPLIVDKARTIPGYDLDSFFKLPTIHMVNQEGRSYIESSNKKFDSIILAWSGATGMHYLGISSYTPQYLFTVEAIEGYLRHLKDGGTFVLVDCNKIKVLAMTRAAFEKLGIRDITRKVIMVGDINMITSGYYKERIGAVYDKICLVLKNSDFTKEDVEGIGRTLRRMEQDFIYNPYITNKDFKVYEDLLKSNDVDSFVRKLSAGYHRNFSIPHDDAPFVRIMSLGEDPFQVIRWAKFLNESSSSNKREIFFRSFMGLFMNFLLVLGLLIIILPLVIRAKKEAILRNYKALVYFALLGLGFILVEIAIMHSFVLLMGNPIYSFAVVLASLLLSAGVGSRLSDRLFQRQKMSLKKLSVSAAILLCCYFILVSHVNRYFLWLPLWSKFLMTVVFIFPLGITLGMFFPQGLKTFSDKNRGLIPLVWGINGYMSIIGSLLCINLSRTSGFSIFMLYAACLYVMIIFFHPKAN